MTLFKCKMCGGTLEINSETVATCEYCGTQQTLPKLSNERRANLYDRANHFRRSNEFDKAMGIYEQILNEDHTDAEAYWSLVLCRYGIEYVEDPASGRRVPTVNRAQFTSIFDDDNYKSALQYADGYQRAVYEEEARTINEIQKGILAISQKEEPFDVFICYKESDNNGRRTLDSVLANDLYHQLTQEGFKVFFARITLEDKLGSAYEPYIFAALNSAKVMVVLGTKPEYFKAVWVRNEWSRYLALIKQGQKKMLIPAYKDMDPYDLPDEFSHLQAQDMGKLGFMQDLIRGIKKIAQNEAPQTTVVKETVIAGSNANTAPLLKRAYMFLEDGDWHAADEYCEKVLDIDPECSMAYMGKLLSQLRVNKEEELKNQETPFDSNNNYQKALRFADEKRKAELVGYIEHINTRNENNRLEGIYTKAQGAMATARTEDAYKQAAAQFERILEYRDAGLLASKCREKGEIARKDAILDRAAALMQVKTIGSRESQIKSFRQAIQCLEPISGWRDADERIETCKKEIAKIQEEMEQARQAALRRAKQKKKRILITSVALCLAVVLAALAVFVVIPYVKYSNAVALMDAGKYHEAISAFDVLDGYKDSASKIDECNIAILDGKFNDAIVLMNEGKYEDAIAALKVLDGYGESVQKIEECELLILDEKYDYAVALVEKGKLMSAYETFVACGEHKDSIEKAAEVYNKIVTESLKTAKVGDYVVLGTYEQDNNFANGKEPIQWLVLEVKDGKALVISKYALDCKPYNTSGGDVTWETCILCKWLNSEFINAAFSAYERALIPIVTVSADKNPHYSTNPGNATQDQVFLLSIKEVNEYFSSDSARQCVPTDYAVGKGAYVNSSNGNCWWWLRSPGDYQHRAAFVNFVGDVSEYGGHVIRDSGAVRPALWIDLDLIKIET